MTVRVVGRAVTQHLDRVSGIALGEGPWATTDSCSELSRLRVRAHGLDFTGVYADADL